MLGLIFCVGLVLIALKILGHIMMAWIWVMVPFMFCAVAIVVTALFFSGFFESKRKRNHNPKDWS